MGLDIVEMILRVEEEFAIVIEDKEASYISTVGQLHALILNKTGLLKPNRCASSATFYQLRRALTDLAVAPREGIRPATPVEALLPASKRRRLWKEWGETAQVKLPDLERPHWMRNIYSLAVAASLASSALVCMVAPGFTFFYLITALALCRLIYQWSLLHANQLPAGCVSVGDATKAVMKLNYGINADWDKARGADEIWDKLKAIVVEEAGVSPGEVTPDADFVRDLRMD